MEKTTDRQFANLRCIEYAAHWKLTEIMMLTNFIVSLKTLSEFNKDCVHNMYSMYDLTFYHATARKVWLTYFLPK